MEHDRAPAPEPTHPDPALEERRTSPRDGAIAGRMTGMTAARYLFGQPAREAYAAALMGALGIVDVHGLCPTCKVVVPLDLETWRCRFCKTDGLVPVLGLVLP